VNPPEVFLIPAKARPWILTRRELCVTFYCGKRVNKPFGGEIAMRNLWVAATALVLLPAALALAEVYRVGPGEKVTKISEIADGLKPGDIVEVTGDIADSMRLRASGTKEAPIVVRGVGEKRPKIDFGGARNGIETNGDHYLFENLELMNASSRGIFQVSADITIRNCYFHDNHNGIMGADDPNVGDILIEYCEFFHNGSGIYAHQMYLASWKPGATATVQYNYIHDSSGGLNIKSRMPHNVVRYNWIENAANYEVDIIDSDQSPVAESLRPMNTEFIGNVVVTGVTGNPHHQMNFGSDQPRSPGTEGTFTVANNTFVMNLASNENHMIRVGGKVKEARFYNNIFVGPNIPEFSVITVQNDKGEDVSVGGPAVLEKLTGANNFIAANCRVFPVEFTGTIKGADAAFADFKAEDLHLAKGSPCVGAGDAKAPMAAHFEPLRKKIVAGDEVKRPAGDKIDLGAFGMTIESIPDGPEATGGK